jgi:hypothetical protein
VLVTRFRELRSLPSCAGLVADAQGRGLDDSSPRCRRRADADDPAAVAIGPSTTWFGSGDKVDAF